MSDSVIHSLEEEIRYLRTLLDENGIAYDFGAFCKRKEEEMELSQMVPIDITPETAKFFFSMFHGRVDVYATRSNSGYYTVCNNRWNNGLCPKQNGKKAKCAECPNKDWPSLNSTILMRHMIGKREDCKDVIGVYVMLKDDTCRFNLMTALQKYAKHFDTQQQKVLVARLEKDIICSLGYNPTRKSYQAIAAKLKNLAAICPAGRELARKALNYYLTTYSNRPAMREELSKVHI